MTSNPLSLSTSGSLRLALLVVVTAAALARLVGLDHLVFWHDEVFTLIRAFGYPQESVHAAIFSARLLEPGFLLGFQSPDPALGWDATLAAFKEHPEHAPLYYALVRLSAGLPLTLDPVSAARGVSALFGLLLIPAVYWLMRELFGLGPAPWVAAVVVACSPLQFLYAQEARQYSLWTLMVVVSSASLLRALARARRPVTEGAGPAGDWWLYGLSLTLGLYSHLLFALVLPVHAAYLYLERRGRSLRPTAGPWALAAAAALAAFGPWLMVLLDRHEQAGNHTDWMTRPLGAQRILSEWASHLTRLFADLDPAGTGGCLLILGPLGWAIWRFLRRAPRPSAWMLAGIAVVYMGAVLGPDLTLGGSRSQHVRYALPATLALQLMVAWVIGVGLDCKAGRARPLAAGALAAICVIGGISIVAIQGADTWWTKGFSASNGEIASILNRGALPLVLASDSGVSTGELISLAHRLDPAVLIWGEHGGAPPPVDRYTELVALMPSPQLSGFLKTLGPLIPVAGTWQWFELATAPAAGDRTDLAGQSPQIRRGPAAGLGGIAP